MSNHDKWTVESAIEVSRQNRLREWVIAFMASKGGNSKIAEGLRGTPDFVCAGLIEADLRSMNRICGAPSEQLHYKDEHWDDNVNAMADAIKGGWNPPPLLISDWFEPANTLSDGNHRCEALLRAGYKKYWTIFLTNTHSS